METHISLFSKIQELLKDKKLIVSDEKQLHRQLIKLFGNTSGFPVFQMEYSLGIKGRVDFFISGSAIEVKIKGSPKAIYRQLKLYAEHDEVKEIILITAKTMTLPGTINGKPAGCINISQSWL